MLVGGGINREGTESMVCNDDALCPKSDEKQSKMPFNSDYHFCGTKKCQTSAATARALSTMTWCYSRQKTNDNT